MNELALFAGAGGGILGGKLLGWDTIGAVERDAYAASVLARRQDDRLLPPFPIWSDVTSFDGRPWRGRVDVISGGFPCQDISTAGKGAGIDGARSGLWGQFARIIREVEPIFVFVENSPMLTSRGLGRVLGDLAEMGFDARWCVLGAVDAGAPHKRERIWIVGWNPHLRKQGSIGAIPRSEPPPESSGTRHATDSDRDSRRLQSIVERGSCHASIAGHDGREESLAYSERTRLEGATGRRMYREGRPPVELAQCDQSIADPDSDRSRQLQPQGSEPAERGRIGDLRENVADSDLSGREKQRSAEPDGAEHEAPECGGWWSSEPDVGRVAHGVAARVDRLKALGNGQVPAVAALAWRILTES